MARKSNKTAHVLNLLSGHDTPKNAEKETEKEITKETGKDTVKETGKEPESKKTQSADTPTVSIIDRTEADPVAEQIQNSLLQEFQKEQAKDPKTDAAVPDVSPKPEDHDAAAVSAAPPVSEEKEAPPTREPVQNTEATEKTEPIQSTEPVQKAEPKQTAEPTEKAEPEFICINVMEQIVKDKIIYFMRQFECCTCEKCIADTTALTLNGLPPKYIVAEPAAKDPLLSFYTNHFISEITVEATKACMTVKENPRHKK